jgi:ParB family transcriptional regulator, chromosome partitioning protein
VEVRQEKHCRKASIAITTGLRVLTAIAAAVQMRLMKLDLLFVAKRVAFLSDENRLTWFWQDREFRAKRGLM